MRVDPPSKRYKYYEVRYAPSFDEEGGVTIALVTLSPSRPNGLAFKRISSWVQVLQVDSGADIKLLDRILSELPENIRRDPQYLDRALGWENSIRVSQPREFITSDFEGTFFLLAEAVLGIG